MAAVLLISLTLPLEVFAKPRKPARPRPFTATAYCDKGKTASGVHTRSGVAAADPRLLPLRSTVRIADPRLRGRTFTIEDTGSAVKGRRIDVFMPSCRDARRFGKRRVVVQVLTRAKPDAAGK